MGSGIAQSRNQLRMDSGYRDPNTGIPVYIGGPPPCSRCTCPGYTPPDPRLGDTAGTDGRARAGSRALGDGKHNETLVEREVTVTSLVTSR